MIVSNKNPYKTKSFLVHSIKKKKNKEKENNKNIKKKINKKSTKK